MGLGIYVIELGANIGRINAINQNDMEELTREQQDYLSKRINLLKHNRDKLKGIKTLHQWKEVHSLISSSLLQEDARIKFENDGYSDCTIIGLKSAKRKMKLVAELMSKDNENKAVDLFWDSINELKRDYDSIIAKIQSETHLWQFFRDKGNG